MNNNDPQTNLKLALTALGAREFEIVALSMEPHRGLAALAYAQQRGVDHPISYAIKVFDNPDWTPTGEKARKATNVAVEVKCATCDGDRFVVHRTRADGSEEMKACPSCNSSLDAGFWKANGERFVVAK